MRRTTDLIRNRLSAEHGFTLIEVMVAVGILTVAILGTVASLDAFRANATRSVNTDAATHRVEQEVEALRGAGYRALVLNASPGTSTNPKDPRYNVSAGSPPTYRPSSNVSADPLVIDATNTDALDPAIPWSSGGVSGTLYRFITKGTDPTSCVQICPRRVSVVATVEKNGAIVSSIVSSTLVIDPQDTGADDTATPSPTTPACPCWNTFYAYDTPATFSMRQTPPGDHAMRQWQNYPDLMGEDPPTTNADGSDPPLYHYTTDLATTPDLQTTAGYPGGAIIQQSGGCNDDANPAKTHRWVSAAALTSTTIYGDAAFTFYTQTAGGYSGLGYLCLTVYAASVDANGKITSKTKWGSFGGAAPYLCNQNPWPVTPDAITCQGRFLTTGTTKTLNPGQRIMMEITVYDTSSYNEVILYDHPSYPSSFTWSSTPAMSS